MNKSKWVLAGMLVVVLSTAAVMSQLAPKQTDPVIVGKAAEFTGRVLNPDGTPASGARVGIVVQHPSMFDEEMPTTETAGDGTFHLILPRETFVELCAIRESVSLVATADGYGMAWEEAGAFLETEQRSDNRATEGSVLTLAVDDTPVNGRILTADGTPASGVRVELVSLSANRKADLGPWLTAVGEGQSYQKLQYLGFLPRHLSGLGLQRIAATTDADGRFRFTGLGRNRLAAFQISGTNVACMTAVVRTAPGERLSVHGLSFLPETQGCFGSEFSLTARPSRSVVGIVTDADSNQPLKGAKVRSVGFANLIGFFAISTVTDDAGRFRLDGFPIGEDNRLVVSIAGDVPYLPAGVSVDTSVEAPPLLEFKMQRGTWIEGTVTDPKTGKPVLATVDAFAPETNSHLGDFPSLTNGSVPSTMLYRTDANGHYRVPAIPGRNVVGVRVIGRAFVGSGGNGMSRNFVRQNGHAYRCLNLPDVNLEGISDNEESRMWMFRTVPWPIESGQYHQLRSVDIPANAESFHCDLTVD